MTLLVLLSIAAASFAQPGMPVEFDGKTYWEPRPTFQANPADEPEVSADEGAVRLGVSEPGRTMKFELQLRPFSVDSATYMLMRYKAENLAGGYAIWVYDGTAGGKEILNTSQLARDGQWHVAAIDLWSAGAVGRVRSLLTEVRCVGEPAYITFDYLRLSDELPEGAVVFPKERKEVKELVIRPGELEGLQPQPDWLANEADNFGATSDDGVLNLFAEEPQSGMKWSVPLKPSVNLSEYGYAAVRYKARNLGDSGDYCVWLGSEGGGMPQEFRSVVTLRELRDDDNWHVSVVPLPEDFEAVEMALQVQSGNGRGDVWIDYVKLSTRRPLIDASDLIAYKAGWAESKLPAGTFGTVDISQSANVQMLPRLRPLGVRSWIPAGRVAVRGIPFEIVDGALDAIATPEDIDETVTLPVDGVAAEVYFLMSSSLPIQDSSGGADPFQLKSVANPERCVFEIEYEDGVVDEMFPVCLGTGEFELIHGIDAYCLPGLRPAPMRQISVRNRMDTGSLVLSAITLNRGEAATETPEVVGLPNLSPARAEDAGSGKITPRAAGYIIENGLIRLDLQTRGGISVRSIENRCLGDAEMSIAPGPLFEIGSGETLLNSEQVAVGEPQLKTEGAIRMLIIPLDGTPGGVPIKGDLTVSIGDGPDLRMDLDLSNSADEVISPVVNFPVVSGITVGTIEDTWYLYACKGGVIGNGPIRRSAAYGGEYPLQVMDVFSPAAGGGLALLTYDLANIYRHWNLLKSDTGVDWRIEYWKREHQPGEKIETAPTVLRAHTGDWRRALRAYADWAHSWYQPQVPRKRWFQEVFYYQQSTAWGSLRNHQTNTWRIDEVIDQYRDYFGRLDYLHIFDFGQSKVYGRVGDYNHYEELGGREAMRAAIKQAQDEDVRIGLYIEGYLCDERGVWGRENVAHNDIRKEDGEPLLWPGAPPEHMMCAASEGWRDHLASTYQRVAGELQPDGMYIDQYGFINTWKTCWSREHGHPVPWAPIRGECDTTEAIRAGIPEHIANLTEETPNDVNSQHQDGALGYSVWSSNPVQMPHRVDLFRFMFPDFKVFQLTQYIAFTEGNWERLKFPFFNGEGYWLGGGTTGSYSDDAHSFLRRAFDILHEYSDAFCSADIEPLVPTLVPTVYANRFSSDAHTVWTVFNAQFRTFRGACLQVAHIPGTRYVNAFTGDELEVDVEDGMAVIDLELGPREVGCVAATKP